METNFETNTRSGESQANLPDNTLWAASYDLPPITKQESERNNKEFVRTTEERPHATEVIRDSMDAQTGSHIEVRLPGCNGIYQWALSKITKEGTPGGVDPVQVSDKIRIDLPPPGGPHGRAGTAVADVYAQGPGAATVEFALRCPWNKDEAPIKLYQLRVRVVE